LINHAAVKLQLDTYHMNMEEDNLPSAIRQAGTRIGHFHCANGNRKLPGQGHVDWKGVKAALDDVDFQGTLVIETFPNPNTETAQSPGQEVSEMCWDEIAAATKVGTVNWYMWGGSDLINKYVSDWVGSQVKDKYGITLNRVGINDTVDAVNKVLGEQQAGNNDK